MRQMLDEFLAPYDPEIRKLAHAVRKYVLGLMTPCCEYVYDAYNAVALGYGPDDRYQDGAVHVAVYSKHVNIGFNRGAEMDDTAKILKGTGKQIRHVTIRRIEDLESETLREYLQRARRDADVRMRFPTRYVGLIVKSISPIKRRPGGD